MQLKPSEEKKEASPAPTPSRAVYGFVMWLASYLSLLLYLLWAILPDHLLQLAGLEFLPQKYWAVAVPIYLSVCFFLLVLVVYPSLGMLITPQPHHLNNVTDRRSGYDEQPGRVLEYLRQRDRLR